VAYGNIAKDEYALHIVNNGADRTATIEGLPQKAKNYRVYATGNKLNMKLIKEVVSENKALKIELPKAAFISVYITY
jgi:hypothetical protein